MTLSYPLGNTCNSMNTQIRTFEIHSGHLPNAAMIVQMKAETAIIIITVNMMFLLWLIATLKL